MTPNGNGEGVYSYEKDDIVLEKGTVYKFKVVKNHAWDEAYPAQDYVLSVDETAKYHVKIFFNGATKEVSHEAKGVTPSASTPTSYTFKLTIKLR